MEKLLKGIRILDFSSYFAGPYASLLLADMGADVIKVEKPGGGDDRKFAPFAPNGESMIPMATLRNKKGITLNPRTDKGKEILQRLVKCSDVVLHSFPVGTEESEILGYDRLKEINPAIIVLAISGFGSTGPYAERPCFDTIAQALSGAMSYTGFPGGPPIRSGAAWVDFSTGTHAALGIMMALYHRQLTGKGQYIDLALLDVAVSCVTSLGVAAEYKVLGYLRGQTGNHSHYNSTDCYQTKDGWIMLGVSGNHIWKRFLRVIGREDLKDDPRLYDDMSRFQNRHVVQKEVGEWMIKKTTEDVILKMAEARVPCGQVNNIAQMVNNPQVKAREAIVDMEYPGVGKVPIPGIPIKMSETPGSIERRATKVGEFNRETYVGLLGFAEKELTQFEAEGVI